MLVSCPPGSGRKLVSTTRIIRWILLLGILAGLALASASCVGAKGRDSVAVEGVDIQEEVPWEAGHPDEYRQAILNGPSTSDIVLSLYRDHASRGEVVSFFSAITKSTATAQAILRYAEQYGVPPNLAFAVAWQESHFDPLAINKNKTSVDRGLFQLNSRSFANIPEKEFFDIESNARLGISHLRWCLDTGSTEVSGLAMYNAGTMRVKDSGAPKKTLDYVSKILAFQNGLDTLFEKEIGSRWLVEDNGSVIATAPGRSKSERVELSSAEPLSSQKGHP